MEERRDSYNILSIDFVILLAAENSYHHQHGKCKQY